MNHVRIVLVEPLYGGNLGSVARAMGNFGLSELVLVNPAEGIFDDPRLVPMARSGARWVRQARVVETLEEALEGVELALGFTTRLGKRRRDGLTLRDAAARVAGELAGNTVAAVFGREDAGLTTAELALCHWLVRIPTHPALSSCNLAQAVMLCCYEMAEARRTHTPREVPRKVASVEQLEGMYGHFAAVLEEIGFIEEANPDRMLNELRRIFSRRLPDPRDVRILRGILAKVQLALERARKGLGRP
jgi:TrmH family RNA methyltransferase